MLYLLGEQIVNELKRKETPPKELLEMDIGTDLRKVAPHADILITAAGQEKIVTASMVKPGAMVIDVGRNVHFDEVSPVAGKITPPIGGVGPITVVSLMERAYKAAKNASYPEHVFFTYR